MTAQQPPFTAHSVGRSVNPHRLPGPQQASGCAPRPLPHPQCSTAPRTIAQPSPNPAPRRSTAMTRVSRSAQNRVPNRFPPEEPTCGLAPFRCVLPSVPALYLRHSLPPTPGLSPHAGRSMPPGLNRSPPDLGSPPTPWVPSHETPTGGSNTWRRSRALWPDCPAPRPASRLLDSDGGPQCFHGPPPRLTAITRHPCPVAPHPCLPAACSGLSSPASQRVFPGRGSSRKPHPSPPSLMNCCWRPTTHQLTFWSFWIYCRQSHRNEEHAATICEMTESHNV